MENKTIWYSNEVIRVLKTNLRCWYFDDGENWLRDNLPTLAGYL